MTAIADKNGLPFRAGLYSYQGPYTIWHGIVVDMKLTDRTSMCSGLVVDDKGVRGTKNGKEVNFFLHKLIRLEEQAIPKVKIDNVFDFNFKD